MCLRWLSRGHGRLSGACVGPPPSLGAAAPGWLPEMPSTRQAMSLPTLQPGQGSPIPWLPVQRHLDNHQPLPMLLNCCSGWPMHCGALIPARSQHGPSSTGSSPSLARSLLQAPLRMPKGSQGNTKTPLLGGSRRGPVTRRGLLPLLHTQRSDGFSSTIISFCDCYFTPCCAHTERAC